jgi:drug/metabolite transporter (DMT)-like permease
MPGSETAGRPTPDCRGTHDRRPGIGVKEICGTLRAMSSRHPITEGVLCALGAGLVWGLVFVAPLMLGDYPPALLAFGRYTAFGLIALPLAWRDRTRLVALERRDWLSAFELGLIGNILYYLCLAAAIQRAGAPLPTLIIGTLPVVIAVASNLHESSLPWRRLLPALAVIATGIALVNHHEMQRLESGRGADYALGAVLACGALICWTWYPMRNARWLKRRPLIASSTWATAQGLATLPPALIGLLVFGAFIDRPGFDYPLGPRPYHFVGLMLAIGLLASWLGTLLWNRASQCLPTALSGQLIVFETLAAFAYAFMWRGEVPTFDALTGIALLVLGVWLGVRAARKNT